MSDHGKLIYGSCVQKYLTLQGFPEFLKVLQSAAQHIYHDKHTTH